MSEFIVCDAAHRGETMRQAQAASLAHSPDAPAAAPGAARAHAQGDGREDGFTLVEVLGALVVGSLIFAFAAFGISGGLESARVSGFNETLELLRINVHEVYASSRGFGSTSTSSEDITSVLTEAGAVPANWLAEDDSTIVHNFGGSVTVEGTVSNFTITASGIPESACRKIVSSQLEAWDIISVGGSEVATLPTTDCQEDVDGLGVNELAFTTH